MNIALFLSRVRKRGRSIEPLFLQRTHSCRFIARTSHDVVEVVPRESIAEVPYGGSGAANFASSIAKAGKGKGRGGEASGESEWDLGVSKILFGGRIRIWRDMGWGYGLIALVFQCVSVCSKGSYYHLKSVRPFWKRRYLPVTTQLHLFSKAGRKY